MIAPRWPGPPSGSAPSPGTAGRTGSRSPSGSSEDQRALAEVVEDQRGEDEQEPGAPDRPAAEVAHVGVQRLGAGDRQHDARRARGTPRAPCSNEELRAVVSATARRGSPGARADLRAGRRSPARRTRRHDRPEQAADARRCRSAGRRTARSGSTSVSGTTSASRSGATTSRPSTADSTRDRRRDHPVAVEQRRAEDAERDQRDRGARGCAGPRRWISAIRAMIPPSPSLSARMMNVTYLTVTIERDRPEDEREDAVDRGRGRARARARARRPSCSAYSGLVPMSPKTTPSAPQDDGSAPHGADVT